MSHYMGACVLRTLADGRTRVLREAFGYRASTLPCTVMVPEGFKTDLASIPRAAWSLLPPIGKYEAAAVIHDWLYWSQELSREDADAVFLDAMIYSGVGRLTRWLIFRAVRTFGGFAWRNNAADRVNGRTRMYDERNDVFLASNAGTPPEGLA